MPTDSKKTGSEFLFYVVFIINSIAFFEVKICKAFILVMENFYINFGLIVTELFHFWVRPNVSLWLARTIWLLWKQKEKSAYMRQTHRKIKKTGGETDKIGIVAY